MEVPIHLAIDTTDAWEKSDTVLGESELAIEIVEADPHGKPLKTYLLLGDGKPVGPGMERLRVKPCHIAGLAENLLALEETDRANRAALNEADRILQENIDAREVFHDGTLTGKGTDKDILSVNPGSFDGLTSYVRLIEEHENGVFKLPPDFMDEKLSFLVINGLLQEPNEDYHLDLEVREIIFSERPEADDRVMFYYTRKKIPVTAGPEEKELDEGGNV